MSHAGVCGVRNAQASNAEDIQRTVNQQQPLKPRGLRISGVVAGLMVRLPTKTASTSRPEWNAFMPKPTSEHQR